jgi:hypothetical protein
MLTALVPLLLCCVVAHGGESRHERAQHTVMMDLISTSEVSLAQLKHESNLVLESASLSASSGTTLANAPSPPPAMQSDTRENYSDIGTKTIPERNTLQLRCDSAKQQHRHEGGSGCQLRGGQLLEILHRTLIELQYFSASVLHRVNQSAMGSDSDWQDLCAQLICPVYALRLHDIGERIMDDESSAIRTSKVGHSENRPTAA